MLDFSLWISHIAVDDLLLKEDLTQDAVLSVPCTGAKIQLPLQLDPWLNSIVLRVLLPVRISRYCFFRDKV